MHKWRSNNNSWLLQIVYLKDIKSKPVITFKPFCKWKLANRSFLISWTQSCKFASLCTFLKPTHASVCKGCSFLGWVRQAHWCNVCWKGVINLIMKYWIWKQMKTIPNLYLLFCNQDESTQLLTPGLITKVKHKYYNISVLFLHYCNSVMCSSPQGWLS